MADMFKSKLFPNAFGLVQLVFGIGISAATPVAGLYSLPSVVYGLSIMIIIIYFAWQDVSSLVYNGADS